MLKRMKIFGLIRLFLKMLINGVVTVYTVFLEYPIALSEQIVFWTQVTFSCLCIVAHAVGSAYIIRAASLARPLRVCLFIYSCLHTI